MPRKVLRGAELITGDLAVAGDLAVTGNITVTGTYTVSGTDLEDTTTFHDPDTATKKARLDCVGVTAGQTRVLTVPDFNGTFATLAGVEAFTNKTLTSAKVGTALLDVNGLELLKVTATADAINELTLANAAQNGTVLLAATGDDTNIPVQLAGKGTGPVKLGQATSTDVRLVADQPIADSSGNELLKFTKTATAVNEFTVANAAAGGTPVLSATGSDSNISIKLTPKALGKVVPAAPVMRHVTVTTNTTASDQTFSAAQIIGGMILRDPNGAARADLLDTAANIVAAVPGAVAGTAFEFAIQNDANAAETITITTNTGLTLAGTMTIAQSNAKRFLALCTNVGSGTEAVTVYSLGTYVF